MNSYFQRLGISLLLFFVAVLLGAIALLGVYSIPTDPIKANILSSIEKYEQQSDYPEWAFNKSTTRLDNFTDSIILRNVLFRNSDSIISSAMLNPRQHYNTKTQIDSLKAAVASQEGYQVITYPQYWHGYLILLKPLLAVIPLSYFMLLNYSFQFIGMAYLLLLVFERLGKGYAVSLFWSYFLLNPVTVATSLQFSSMLNLIIVLSIFLLKKWQLCTRNMNYLYFFVVSGILTSFFDLLTYPVISLGIPLIILLVGLNGDKLLTTTKKSILLVIESSLFWGLGYGLMFVGKWLLASSLTGVNIINIAMSQLAHRMSYNGSENVNIVLNINPIRAISRNLQVLAHEPILIILLVVLGIAIYYFAKKKKQANLIKQQNLKPLKVGLGMVALFPFLWYTALTNHSFVHAFFTYRELSILVFAIGSLITVGCREYDNIDV